MNNKNVTVDGSLNEVQLQEPEDPNDGFKDGFEVLTDTVESEFTFEEVPRDEEQAKAEQDALDETIELVATDEIDENSVIIWIDSQRIKPLIYVKKHPEKTGYFAFRVGIDNPHGHGSMYFEDQLSAIKKIQNHFYRNALSIKTEMVIEN